MLKKTLSGLLAFALALLPLSESALAQTYPVNNPSYTPTMIVPAQSLSGTAPINSTTIRLNNISTLTVRVLGTNAGMVATFQGAEVLTPTTWSNLTVEPVGTAGAPRQMVITGNGLYRLNTSGLTSVRLNITALSSGTVLLTGSGTSAGGSILQTTDAARTTCSASIAGLVGAAAATDVFTLAGSATKTIRITKVTFSGRATAAANADVALVKRSTADTGGTAGTVPTVVNYDASAPACTAVAGTYTANPTAGTLVGNVAVKQNFLGNLTTGQPGSPAEFVLGGNGTQALVLRGVAQQAAVNLSAATFAGNLLDITVEWTEE